MKKTLLTVAGCLLFLTGCVPGVAWLPDSSGFIYTAGKEHRQLVHFDVAQKKSHVLVEDTKAPTFWPAVSPDGKEIAVAHLAGEIDKAKTMQFIFFSRAGKELRRSKVFPWARAQRYGGATVGADIEGPQLFWSPRGDKIVAYGQYKTGIYDVKSGSLNQLADQTLLLIFGGLPIRPDGAGFIIVRQKEMDDQIPSEIRFVDWNGKETDIKEPPLFKDKQALKKQTDVNKLVALLCPAMYQSSWEGNSAQVSWNIDRLRYETKRGAFILDSIKPEKASDGLLIKQKFVFSDTKIQVRTVTPPVKEDNGVPRIRVEIVKDGKPQVVLEQTDACILVPSPNRKLVALRCLVENPREKNGRALDERILVVNQAGELVAHLHVGK